MTAARQHSRLLRENEIEYGEESIAELGIHSETEQTLNCKNICRALHRVLDSPEFSSVIQLRAFLNYVVAKTIENRGDEIKGYTIAVEALGRDSSFNPVTDPIVRVEAARLRRRLDDYYSGSGKSDPIIIEIPKGSYEPEFILRQHLQEPGNDEPAEAPPPTNISSREAHETSSADAPEQYPALENASRDSSPAPPAEGISIDENALPRPVTRSLPALGLMASPLADRAIPVKVWMPIGAMTFILSFVSGYLIGAFS